MSSSTQAVKTQDSNLHFYFYGFANKEADLVICFLACGTEEQKFRFGTDPWHWEVTPKWCTMKKTNKELENNSAL